MDDLANSFVQTVDGGYIAVGSSRSMDGDVTGHHGDQDRYDVWVTKVDANGRL
jgi:hypothetical protein